MKSTMHLVREKIRGRDLPKKWQRKAKAKPNELVLVTIQIPNEHETSITLAELPALLKRVPLPPKASNTYKQDIQKIRDYASLPSSPWE